MRKKLVVALVATMAFASLGACSQDNSGSQDETTAIDPNVTATLRIWNPQDNWRKTTKFYPSQTAAFEEKYPNVTIEYVDVPYGQYEARYTAAFSSNSEAPDIFMGQVSYYGAGQKIAAKAPADLQEQWTEELTKATAPNFQIDGQWHGYPVSTDLGMQLFYNKDHFVAAGLDPETPPTTFEELREASAKLATVENGKVTRSGMALRYSGSGTGIVDKALPYIHAFGGRLYAEDESTSEGFINGPGTVAGLQYMQDLVHKDQSSSLELGAPDDAFAQELASMTFREGWYEGWLRDNAPGMNVGIAPYPEGPEGYPKVSLLFNWAWMVNSRSDNEALAWEWMRTIANPETDLALAELEGYLPVWESNFDNAYVSERIDYPAVQKQLESGPGPAYTAPYTNQIAAVVGPKFEEIFQGADVQTVLDSVVTEVDEQLERGN